MQYLSFNEAVGGKGQIKGLPEEDSDTQRALLDPMPLRDTWVLWEQAVPPSDGKSSAYADSMKEIVPFKTAQEFWSIWNGVPQPSELLDNKRITRDNGGNPTAIDAIMIFKKGVRPEWEDPLNATGGHFQVQLKSSIGGAQIDEYWNNIVLGMVGGTIEPYDMITGVRLVDKLSGAKAAGILRIELWFTKYDNQDAVNALKKSMEKTMCEKLDGTPGTAVKIELKRVGPGCASKIFGKWACASLPAPVPTRPDLQN
ncbi:tif452 [Symbiodinium sp. CCMP2592]|nr:tif452 [Symbiodinium sp. CCMP2592]